MVLTEIITFSATIMGNFFNSMDSVEIEAGITLLDLALSIYFLVIVINFYKAILENNHGDS